MERSREIEKARHNNNSLFPRTGNELIQLLPFSRLIADVAVVSIMVICLLLWGRQPSIQANTLLSLNEQHTHPRLESDGFYPNEQLDGRIVRWSSGSALVQVPNAASLAEQYIATMTLRSGAAQDNYPVDISANERPLIRLTPTSSYRTYRFLVPVPANDHTLRLNLATTPFIPAINPRELGIIVADIKLQGVPTTSLTDALAISVLSVLAYLFARWRGGDMLRALVFSSCLGVFLVTGKLLAGPTPLPIIVLVGLASVGAACTYVLATNIFQRVTLALLCVLVSFSGAIWPSWMTDDALISFRYSQNLVDGNGLVYNVGERVEGYTNFLWTMLFALVLRLRCNPIFCAYLFGVSLGLSLLLVTFYIGKRLSNDWQALGAACIVGTSQSVLLYSARGSGLETSLFSLLILIGIGLIAQPTHSRPKLVLSGTILALATMTRPEGAFVFILVLLYFVLLSKNSHAVRTQLKLSLPILISYTVLYVPYFIWRFNYYGDLLPNTFYAKTGGGLSHVIKGSLYTMAFAVELGGPLVLLAFLPTWINKQLIRGWQGCLLLVVGVYTLYIIVVGGDHFPGARFFVPLVPLLALLMSQGSGILFTFMLRYHPFVRFSHAIVVVLAILYCTWALARTQYFDSIVSGDDESLRIWREYGWWFADHAPEDTSIAALGAGAIAYESKHTTIDLLGLTEKHIAHVSIVEPGTATVGHEKRDPRYVLDTRKPTYIPRIWDFYFGGEDALRDTYTLIHGTSRYGRPLEIWRRLP